ncbi:hypothetical protein [Piscirickettsia litoralis]|uniref:Uncharacterized protein n=1 Tax=Piscirickettsia litoralis TaxID=1891921 RepID=A0ABX3A3U6_9GAMM|nr:hypothetical protein [Piscirickettsia litoralis]ODN43532.1 hypothetical protein BGC07_12140 [Piscirickettsia litoralis]
MNQLHGWIDRCIHQVHRDHHFEPHKTYHLTYNGADYQLEDYQNLKFYFSRHDDHESEVEVFEGFIDKDPLYLEKIAQALTTSGEHQLPHA